MMKISTAVSPNSFSSNALVSLFSSVLSRLITLVAVAGITRLYPAHQFGIWVLILAIANFFAPFCTFRFELPLVLAPTKRLAGGLLLTLAATTLATTIILILVIAVLPNGYVERLFKIDPMQTSMLIYVPPLLLAVATQNILQMWLMRTSQFWTISLATVTHAFVTAVLVIVMPSISRASAGAIVTSSLIGYGAANAVLLLTIWPDLRRVIAMRARLATSLAAVRRYSVYPKYIFPQAMSVIFSERVIQFLLASIFSVELLAVYFVARQSLMGPASILAASVRNVIFAHGARDVSIATTRHRTRSMLNILLMVIAPGLAWGVFWISKLALVVFGSRWPELPVMSWYCMFPAAAMIFTGPLDRLFDLASRQRFSGMLQIANDLVLVSLTLLSVHFGASGLQLIAMISTTAVAYNMLWLCCALSVIGTPKQDIWSFFTRFLALFLTCCALQYCVSCLPGPYLSLFGSLFVLTVTGLFGAYRAAREIGLVRGGFLSTSLAGKDES